MNTHTHKPTLVAVAAVVVVVVLMVMVVTVLIMVVVAVIVAAVVVVPWVVCGVVVGGCKCDCVGIDVLSLGSWYW